MSIIFNGGKTRPVKAMVLSKQDVVPRKRSRFQIHAEKLLEFCSSGEIGWRFYCLSDMLRVDLDVSYI